MRKWPWAVLVCVVVVAVYVTNVLATPPSGFTAAQQWKGVFGEIDLHVATKEAKQPGHKVKLETRGESDLYVTRNVIAPGGASGWHTHPGPSLIIVAVGEITAYEGDDPTCTPTRYKAGEGFVDPGDGHVHLLRNETDAQAETVAVQILPKGATRRDDMPAPGNCGF
ncbi:MAG TPA: cupin domain-containing protein [Gaiellaceae bacterium]|nr:cupin domain-containing protein [Gaiellaceae bacterium]